jgi:hypothetical protein
MTASQFSIFTLSIHGPRMSKQTKYRCRRARLIHDEEANRCARAQESLGLACSCCDLVAARAALDAGAFATVTGVSPRVQGSHGMHSLLQKVAMASISGFPMARHSNLNGPALIRLLVDHGADPNAITPDCSRGIRAAAVPTLKLTTTCHS